jgi:hypothetical protein
VEPRFTDATRVAAAWRLRCGMAACAMAAEYAAGEAMPEPRRAHDMLATPTTPYDVVEFFMLVTLLSRVMSVP